MVFLLRDINIEVNGEVRQVARATTATELLDAHDAFGTQPGRLVSIGGNVLDESGGTRCVLTVNGEAVPDDSFGTLTFTEGDVLTVENGTDVTESSHEEEAVAAPGIQMQTGSAVQYVAQWGVSGKKRVQVGDVSGETRDIEVIVPATDMVVASVNPAPEGGNYVALTFDDGPSDYTPAILDVLKEKGVHATFFNLGNQASYRQDLCRRVVAEGHELASHTYAHQNLPTIGRDALREDVVSAFDALEAASGARPGMIRAPYGAFTEVEWARAADLISCNVLWNIDTLDWTQPGVDAIVASVLDNAYNGAIVLMHDGGGDRSQNVDALGRIIDGLHKRGFTLVTVGELMRLDGRVPEAVINGTVAMPEGAELPVL